MVKNGIDCIDQYDSVFQNKRLGLITSVSGVNAGLESSVEILHKRYGLSALYGPEHGVRGNVGAGDVVELDKDPYTGIPVYSLYRKDSKRLTKEMLLAVDAVIYDIQDLGIRYYTFISTMMYALEDCAAHGKELIILDRYNPLGSLAEGNCLKPGFESFVGAYPLCMRYGMTVGELAVMVNQEKKIGCRLTVIPCEGWSRRMMFPQTGRVWVMPSLAMPRFETALLYGGTCLFEGTNVSEGRGTAAPFEIIGAPFLDGVGLARQMKGHQLPGVLFSPVYFKPSCSKYEGEQCQGVQIHITDPESYEACKTGLILMDEIRRMSGGAFTFLPPYKEGGRPMIDLLFGSDRLFRSCGVEELLEEMDQDAKEFSRRRKEFLIYQV